MGMLKGNWVGGRMVFPVGEKGVEISNTKFNNKDTSGGSRTLTLTGAISGAIECTQGVLQVNLTRDVGHPFTAATWGGAEDMACRINVYNYSALSTSYGGMQGLRVYARQYAGGCMANIYAAKFDTDDRGTAVAGASVAVIQTVTISQRCNTIVSTKANVLVVEDNSQGTLTPTTPQGTAMVVIRSTSAIASGARASAIHFETSGSGSGWTSAFSFQTRAGLEGYTGSLAAAHHGTVLGYIKVRDVAGAAYGYINVYAEAPE